MEHYVRQAFRALGNNEKSLVAAVESLARKHGEEIYRQVFLYLLRKDIDAGRANRYWREALARWENNSRLKQASQGIRAALLDHLHSVVGEKLASATDGLTGLHCQGHFKAHLDTMLALSRRKSSSALTVALLAIDDLSCWTAARQGLEGDRILRRLADLIRGNIRDMDTAARLDNGNFALILPDSTRHQAYPVVERIRAAAKGEAPFGQDDSGRPELTLSSGLATFPHDGDSATALMREANRYLILAQKEGSRVFPESPERRREHRRRLCSMVELSVGERELRQAVVYDISRCGVAIGCNAELPPGGLVRMNFRRPFWPLERRVTATIRQTRRQNGCGMQQIGLEFCRPEDDLYRLSVLRARGSAPPPRPLRA